ncbi:MAG TPA: DUF551 domain-containing protein [Chitinophagaceae bacterium]|nr:DUF551 domain-containing protein [Chitinophagaceae bacterium]
MEKWINVEQLLPDYDVPVLIYWKLEKDKKEGGYWDMIEIAHLASITIGKSYKQTEWKDADYNLKKPTHWMPLPQPPKQ